MVVMSSGGVLTQESLLASYSVARWLELDGALNRARMGTSLPAFESSQRRAPGS